MRHVGLGRAGRPGRRPARLFVGRGAVAHRPCEARNGRSRERAAGTRQERQQSQGQLPHNVQSPSDRTNAGRVPDPCGQRRPARKARPAPTVLRRRQLAPAPPARVRPPPSAAFPLLLRFTPKARPASACGKGVGHSGLPRPRDGWPARGDMLARHLGRARRRRAATSAARAAPILRAPRLTARPAAGRHARAPKRSSAGRPRSKQDGREGKRTRKEGARALASWSRRPLAETRRMRLCREWERAGEDLGCCGRPESRERAGRRGRGGDGRRREETAGVMSPC